MTFYQQYGIPPEVLAAAEDASALMSRMRPVLDMIQSAQPVLEIIARQRDTMETIRRSYELALPPATRQALTDAARFLRDHPPAADDLAARARSAGPAIAGLVGQDLTPAQVEEVRQGVDEIQADPELSGQMRHAVEHVDWAAVGKLTPWTLLCVAWVLLFKLADQTTDPAQAAVLSNHLQVLILITALAGIIITIQKD